MATISPYASIIIEGPLIDTEAYNSGRYICRVLANTVTLKVFRGPEPEELLAITRKYVDTLRRWQSDAKVARL